VPRVVVVVVVVPSVVVVVVPRVVVAIVPCVVGFVVEPRVVGVVEEEPTEEFDLVAFVGKAAARMALSSSSLYSSL